MRHIIPVSGGKDSGALALWLHKNRPLLEGEYECVFTDTLSELPETYEFLDRLGEALGKPVTRLVAAGGGLKDYIKKWGGFLPNGQARYCTRISKIKPFEDYVGDEPCVVYIAFTADESERAGHLYSAKPTLRHEYPFIEAGIVDSMRVLCEFGVAPPSYYSWRSRSGCSFCFFQRKREWKGLLKRHPELFEEAEDLERDKEFKWRGKDKPLSRIRDEVEWEERQGTLFPSDEIERDDYSDEACTACSI